MKDILEVVAADIAAAVQKFFQRADTLNKRKSGFSQTRWNIKLNFILYKISRWRDNLMSGWTKRRSYTYQASESIDA